MCSAKKRKHAPTPVEQAVRFYEGGGYLVLNLSGMDKAAPTLRCLQNFCLHFHADEWGWLPGREINDPLQSTLLLLGLPGRGTGFHEDWSEAYNVALPLLGVSSSVSCQLMQCLNNACVSHHPRHVTFYTTMVHLFADRARLTSGQMGLHQPSEGRSCGSVCEEVESNWLCG